MYCFSAVYRIISRIKRKENDEQGTTEFITLLWEIERLVLIFIMKKRAFCFNLFRALVATSKFESRDLVPIN